MPKKTIAGNELRIICYMDSMGYDCLKYECQMFKLDFTNWKDLFESVRPHIFLVYTCWGGMHKNLLDLCKSKDTGEENIFDWCKKNSVPTVYWNQEDPVSFNTFFNIAKYFDYVYTTDSDCIDKYRSQLRHNRVYVMPHLIQPLIHNPIDKNENKLNNVGFAGVWYAMRPNRTKDMEMLFDAASKYGLDIYNRMYYVNYTPAYKFPDKYNYFIKPSVSFERMGHLYKGYNVFLTVSTVTSSPTMFSRRGSEALANGTCVISSPAVSIKLLFNDIINIADNIEQADKLLSQLLNNKDLMERKSLLGQRCIFNNYCYERFVTDILNNTGLTSMIKTEPGVSVICILKNIGNLHKILYCYNNQTIKDKELVLLTDQEVNVPDTSANKYIKVIPVDKNTSRKRLIEIAVGNSKHEACSIFDENDLYCKDFLNDMMNTFKYSEAEVCGKHTYFSLVEGKVSLLNDGNEYKYSNCACCNAFVFNKDSLPEINSILEEGKELLSFTNIGDKFMYSSDKFNYLKNGADIIPANVDDVALRQNSMVKFVLV